MTGIRSLLATLLLGLFIACSASSSGGSDPATGGAGSGGAGGSGGSGGGINLDSGPDGDEPPPAVATLIGTVLAPEGKIPIAGALVYVTKNTPKPIPDGLYCDKCVKLDYSTPYTFSGADGGFHLGVPETGTWKLVVQKGQFQRVRSIEVTAGNVPVPLASTLLPAKTDKANGDTIPKMAIVEGAWDAIDVSLARLGLGTVGPTGPFGMLQVDRSTAPYDYYDGGPGSKGGHEAILKNWTTLSQYHIVFLPCSWSDQTTCDTSSPALDPTVQKNLKDFVAQGGKLYTTDYSYEFVRQIFPGFVDWKNQTGTLGSACLSSAWDAPASSPDKGLTAWLATQAITAFDVKENWTAISAVKPGSGVDPDGKPVTVTPKVWVEANTQWGKLPATISFEQACGRVLFSTYHTEGSSPTMLPQERALLYILLEVAVCVAPAQVN
ncbi:MAG: carboxypeptidase regulatory-like domain-containing protein [Polyangiaceae bacterium]|nr:carboxypeptidase regulatory-like domain-containing protein [Polyangiaceae bacterium]